MLGVYVKRDWMVPVNTQYLRPSAMPVHVCVLGVIVLGVYVYVYCNCLCACVCMLKAVVVAVVSGTRLEGEIYTKHKCIHGHVHVYAGVLMYVCGFVYACGCFVVHVDVFCGACGCACAYVFVHMYLYICMCIIQYLHKPLG